MHNKKFSARIVIGALSVIALVTALVASGPLQRASAAGSGSQTTAQSEKKSEKMSTNEAVAIFAGGCFWCMEQAMEEVPGVKDAISGYVGGHAKNPTYRQVSAGGTGHAEAVKVIYDPKKVSYAKLLDAFWHNIDPVTANRQFCDGGSQYRAGIFYLNDEQKKLAQASKARLVANNPFGKPIVTEVTKAGTFYPAEDYHQGYYKKNPIRYNYYKFACGRKQRLKQLWGAHKKAS